MKYYKAINWWWIRETTGNKRNLLDWIWCWLQNKIIFILKLLCMDFQCNHWLFHLCACHFWKFHGNMVKFFLNFTYWICVGFNEIEFWCQIQGDLLQVQISFSKLIIDLIVIRSNYCGVHYWTVTQYFLNNWNVEFLFLNCMLLQGGVQLISSDVDTWWFVGGCWCAVETQCIQCHLSW